MKSNCVVIVLLALIFSSCNSHSSRNNENISYVVVPIELREQVREYVLSKTYIGMQEMIESASNDESVPQEYLFLIDIAKDIYNRENMPMPYIMDSRTVLSSFFSRREALEAIETYYRNEIFRLFYRNPNEAYRLFNMNITGNSAGNVLERSKLTFHIIDIEATESFNNYYKNNPATTFDMAGNLVNPSIVPSDVIVLGVYVKDPYGLDEHDRNPDGSLRYVVLSRKVGLDGNHIRSAIVERNNQDGKPEVTFMLDDEGANIFYLLTSSNIGNAMAIVLDDKVRYQATIQSAIRDAVRLTGFDYEEAHLISQMLRNR